MQTRHILGLDIGANSIGWAAVECRPDALLPVRLMDLNAHIFQEAVDNKQVPFNAHRRENRLMRRQIARRASRRRGLVGMLQGAGFLPSVWDAAAANKVDREFAERILRDPKAKPFIGDADEKTLASPFAMRAYALEHSLTPHEFGRVILHLHRRRGFRSNRGAKYADLLKELGKSDFDIDATDMKAEAGGDAQKEKEVGKVLGGIAGLLQEMERRGSRTVGEHVWETAKESGIPPARITTESVHFAEAEREARGGKPAGMEKIPLYANREMTEREFDAVCDAQMTFGMAGLNKKMRDEIRAAVFEQLPVQSPPPPSRRLGHLRYNAVGACSLEPGRRRADKAAPVSQEFRTWAVINNIAAMDGELPSPERRLALFNACQDPAQLNKQGRMSWTAAAKILDIGKLNYDRDNPDAKSGLTGNRAVLDLRKTMGAENWKRFSGDADKIGQLTEDLLTITDKLALYNRLIRRWKFSAGADGVAFRLATLELEGGHMKYSRRAMERMLKHMRPRPKAGHEGMNEHDAKEAAGYGDIQSRAKPGDPAKELLPLAAMPETANPRVQRAMFAVRRIVNAAARKWGTPAAIRVEMPRDMKAAKKHRKEIESKQAQNRKANAKAEAELIKLAQSPNSAYKPSPLKGRSPLAGKSAYCVSRADRDKFKMWEFEQERKCPYCGERIPEGEVLSEAFEVDHILPQSAFRQSYMNTVVACRNCNREKAGRTPYEAWGDSEQWEGIARRADLDGKKAEMPKLPREKRRRILNKKHNPLDDEEFCNRALQDTQYIAVLVRQFLAATGIPVQVGRGQATAILRREWGLDDVLPRHPDDELKPEDFDENGILRTREDSKPNKNRRDHRHHAVDAFVVALTDPGTLQRLTKREQERRELGLKKHTDAFPPPESWAENISGQARALLREKIVSHRKTGKVRGALHEGTIRGRGFYVEKLPWPASASKRKEMAELLKRKPGLNGGADDNGDDDGKIRWILNARIHSALTEWMKPQHNPPPKEISEIPVACRYYFHRRKVEDALKRAKGEWRPGISGGWIIDKGIHNALREWLKKHALSPDDKDDKTGIAKALATDPPKTPARKGRRGNVIKTVRMGYFKGKGGVKTLKPKARKNRPTPPPRPVKLGSNHHLEIFRKGGERELRMVSMLEAAQRKQRQEPMVNRNSEWGEGWEFQCSLAEGDLVVFNREEVNERVREILDSHEKQFHSLVYRVQNMSLPDGPDIAFRHHSVSGTDGKDTHGLIRVKSKKDLAIRKKEVGALGADYSALER